MKSGLDAKLLSIKNRLLRKNPGKISPYLPIYSPVQCTVKLSKKLQCAIEPFKGTQVHSQ